MRLVVTNLTYPEVQPRLPELVDALYKRVPTGVGSTGFLRLSHDAFREVLTEGARWCARQGYGWPEDLERTEDGGCFRGVDASAVSRKASESRPSAPHRQHQRVTPMPYAYLDDMALADLALRAWGATLEETFVAAAEATTNAMVEDVQTIAPQQQRTFTLHDAQLDLLLLQFLQELLYYKDAQRLFLRARQVSIQPDDGGFLLQARAEGESIDPAKHALGADVKGVTLHHLQVVVTPEGWEATVILDV